MSYPHGFRPRYLESWTFALWLFLLIGWLVFPSRICVLQAANQSTPTNQTGLLPGLITDLGSNQLKLGQVILNTSNRTIRVPAQINLTNLILEYALVHEQGKTHESLLSTTVAPRDVHLACLLLNYRPNPLLGPTNENIQAPRASLMTIVIEWTNSTGNQSLLLSDAIALADKTSMTITGKFAKLPWLYSGSAVRDNQLAAEEEGSIISLIRDPVAIFQNTGISRDDDDIHVPQPTRVPPKGTPVVVVFRPLDEKDPPPKR